jgi:choline monooxygenase
MREVFERGWALVAHCSELAEVGQYVVATIGREPVLVIRGSDGKLRALSNVCRHRGSTIAGGAGTARKVMRCPYHAWTYRLDGSLAAAPSARGFNDFDRDAVRLPEFAVAELGGLVFASASSDPMPLAEVLGPAGPFLESLNLERLVVYRWGPSGAGRAAALRGLRRHNPRFWEDFDENWKVLADNYLEDYHVPVAHPALVRLNDTKETVGEGEEWSEWSSFPLRSRPSRVPLERLYQRLARKMPGLPDRFDGGWGHAHLWPTTFMEIYPHHVDTWQLEPLGVGRTRAWTMSLVDPDAGIRDRLARWAAHRLMHDVMAEDVEITSRVQRGLRAPSYRDGVLNDEQEVSVVRFQRQLRKLLPRIAELEAEEPR